MNRRRERRRSHRLGWRRSSRLGVGVSAGILAVALLAILGFSITARDGSGAENKPIAAPSTHPTPAAPTPMPAAPTPTADPDAPIVVTFPGSAGSAPDTDLWNYETGGSGWGNGELQTYTRSTQNAFVDGSGHLVIQALKQTRRGTDGISRDFTSARLTTAGKLVIAPGSYVSATLTAPVGKGVWPAFWLIGTNVDTVGWPRSGELDVLEGDAPAPNLAQTAIHLPSAAKPSVDKPYPQTWPGGTVDVGGSLDAAPHEYGVYFDKNVVRFFVDRKQNMVVTAAEAVASGRIWPFGNPQYIVLNVAIARTGSAYGADFPQQMTISNIAVWPHGLPFAAS